MGEVLPELRQGLVHHDLDPDQTLDEKHLHKPVLDAHRYLTGNQARMHYAQYRRQGLPVTTASPCTWLPDPAAPTSDAQHPQPPPELQQKLTWTQGILLTQVGCHWQLVCQCRERAREP